MHIAGRFVDEGGGGVGGGKCEGWAGRDRERGGKWGGGELEQFRNRYQETKK